MLADQRLDGVESALELGAGGAERDAHVVAEVRQLRRAALARVHVEEQPRHRDDLPLEARAEEAEAALEDAKLSAKIAADAARMESMEATSLARKHADEVAQARIALADARKHAAGAEKRADIAIARVERRCKEIEARTDRDVDRLTMAVETAERAQKASV